MKGDSSAVVRRRRDRGPHPRVVRVGARLLAGANSVREAGLAEGLSEATLKNCGANGYSREETMRAALAVQPKAPASLRKLEESIRREIENRVAEGRASDGLLAAGWKVANDALSGEIEPVGVSQADHDLAQQLVYLAARIAVERAWNRARRDAPVPELDDEDRRAIRVSALYEQLAAEERAAEATVMLDGKSGDVVDAEPVEPTTDSESAE